MIMPTTYRLPARSLGVGAMVRRRTPAGAIIDHLVDRIELRPGDEVRIDLVDPATGWGAFLVLDGSAEVDVVDPTAPAGVIIGPADVIAATDADPRELCFLLLADGTRCHRYADHGDDEFGHVSAAGATTRLASDHDTEGNGS